MAALRSGQDTDDDDDHNDQTYYIMSLRAITHIVFYQYSEWLVM